jgi:biotin transport system substrate-specific component
LACLFSALCCAGAYIALPLGPVPLALGNFFALLAGLLLGPLWGSVSVAMYLFIGALGFPVFSGGRGGIAVLIGPTGGYLAGYLIGAFCAGLIAKALKGRAEGRRAKLSIVLATCTGYALVLGLGLLWLKFIGRLDWGKALAVGLLPFLPGDVIKVVLSVLIASSLGPFMDSLSGAGGHRD